ncbi:hypothetical protein V500_08737 [Pseudogymnoascus sp. VKM F-4518 (FW-2643)]|nr:hypothetical protein V500_08737 [Pseudogymnoascus sp. VKM F-4518 (FW-2643)]
MLNPPAAGCLSPRTEFSRLRRRRHAQNAAPSTPALADDLFDIRHDPPRQLCRRYITTYSAVSRAPGGIHRGGSMSGWEEEAEEEVHT